MPRGDVGSQDLSPRYRRNVQNSQHIRHLFRFFNGKVFCVIFASTTLQAHELDIQEELLGCGSQV
jgi:hypothetical protein